MADFGRRASEWLYADGFLNWTPGSTEQLNVVIDSGDVGDTYGRSFIYTTWYMLNGAAGGSTVSSPVRVTTGLSVGLDFGSSLRPPLPDPERWMQIRHTQIAMDGYPTGDATDPAWRYKNSTHVRFSDETQGQRTKAVPGDALMFSAWCNSDALNSFDLVELVWAVRTLKFTAPPTT